MSRETRTLAEIQAALKAPIPSSYLATRRQGNTTITYIPWHKVAELLDIYAPGWHWTITSCQACGNRLVLVGRLTIPTADGSISREATGTELLDCGSYGDPSSNAESMAFRRAAAKFGLGLSLYDKGQPSRPVALIGSRRPTGAPAVPS